MIRILSVSPVGHFGGAEVLLLDVLAGLAKRGHQTLLISCGGDDQPELARLAGERGVEVSTTPLARLRNPLALRTTSAHVRRVARAFAAEVVHCNHPHGALIGRLARVSRLPLSIQLLDPPPRRDPAATAMALVRGDFVSISHTTTDAYRRRLRLARTLETIRPGRDLGGFRTAAARGDASRVLRSAGLDPAAAPLVVMVGRLQEFKGIFRLIDTAAMLPQATFIHIGPDAPTEPGTRERAKATILARGLTGRVGLAGPVALADLAATVARADVLAHLAFGETFGLVLVEAMAVGTPPVAMMGPGPCEILGNGGGILLLDGAPRTVAAAVGGLLSDRSRLSVLAHAATESSGAFAIDRMVDEYERRFVRLVDKSATGQA